MTPHLKTMFSAEDEAYMGRAIALAENGLFTTKPNPRVGCVIVQNHQIVGEGWHQWAGENHAEVAALRAAGSKARGATAYVSLEPCNHQGRTPPCTQALIDSGVIRVVAAMEDPNPRVSGSGLAALRSAGITAQSGLMTREAEALNLGFIRRMKTGKPYVLSKIGMSIDGKTAMASGESQWITSQESRQDVHKLRARCSAILTGSGTFLADRPSLNVRPTPDMGPVQQPARILLDPRGICPQVGPFFENPGSVQVLTLKNTPSHGGRLNLEFVIEWLGQQEFNEILFECGPTLNGALLEAGLVDEWVLYVAPKILGQHARSAFAIPDIQFLAECPQLAIDSVSQIGPDLRLTLKSITEIP